MKRGQESLRFPGEPEPPEHPGGRTHPAVQVDGADERLQALGEDPAGGPDRLGGLPFSPADVVGEVEAFRKPAEPGHIHQVHLLVGDRTLVVRSPCNHRLHDRDVDDRIAEGGEGVHVGAGREAGLQGIGEAGQRPLEQFPAHKGIADPRLDLGRVPAVHKKGLLQDFGLLDPDGDLGLIGGVRRDLPDLVDDVEALNHFTEDRVGARRPGVVPVEEVVLHQVDEELTPAGVRAAGVRHRDRPPDVRVALHELVGDGVARPARSGAGGIAALDHEPGDDPVEDRPVIEPGFRQFRKISCSHRHVVVEPDRDVAHGRVEHDFCLCHNH